jgi:sigma-B regulation protein RsbU (phosphoserine phosphatase)
MRILVVDDSEDSRDIAEAALMSAGYMDVATAGSAAEAYKLLDIGGKSDGKDVPVDLMLLDIVMPKIDGIEACARIRSDVRYSDVPVIMVTALADMDSLANAFVAGANDYITKPLNRIELLARVRSALKLKAELERRQARERELLTFLSTWGDRRASMWIDEATGLFVGEVAEAYLTAATEQQSDEVISLVALAIDRFDIYRSGQGEDVARGILARVANTVRGVAATIGAVAAAYRNGLIILVLPEYGAAAARKLGETLCAAVSKLDIANAESVAADHVTASVAVVTGSVRRGIGRVHLLTHAISTIKGSVTTGGNQVVAVNI